VEIWLGSAGGVANDDETGAVRTGRAALVGRASGAAPLRTGAEETDAAAAAGATSSVGALGGRAAASAGGLGAGPKLDGARTGVRDEVGRGAVATMRTATSAVMPTAALA
jgi:hypothetical protein